MHNLVELLMQQVSNIVQLRYPDKVSYTTTEVLYKALQLSSRLPQTAIVGTFFQNRTETLICEFANYLSGNVTVSLYVKHGFKGINHILEETGMTVMICTEDKYRYLEREFRGKIKEYFIIMDEKTPLLTLNNNTKSSNSNKESNSCTVNSTNPHSEHIEDQPIKFIPEPIADGSEIIAPKLHFIYLTNLEKCEDGCDCMNNQFVLENSDLFEKARERIKLNKREVATICYTSGTTSNPKGVILTHNNFISTILALKKSQFFQVKTSDRYLSFLPYAHVLEKLMLFIMLFYGCEVNFFSGNLDELGFDMQLVKPTIFVSVPQMYTKMVEKVLFRINSLNPLIKYPLLGFIKLKHYLLTKNDSNFLANLLIGLGKSTFLHRINNQLRCCMSGGAVLPKETALWVETLFCCKLFQGYGQTETTGATLCGLIKENKVDSVGVQFPHTEVKLVNEELFVRGEGVSCGYFVRRNNSDSTNSGYICIDDIVVRSNREKDGFLATGDKMALRNGRYFLVGRIKDIFKIINGEYIAPEKLESFFKMDGINNVFVFPYKNTFAVLISSDVPNIKSKFIDHYKSLYMKSLISSHEQPRHIFIMKGSFEQYETVYTPTGKLIRREMEYLINTGRIVLNENVE